MKPIIIELLLGSDCSNNHIPIFLPLVDDSSHHIHLDTTMGVNIGKYEEKTNTRKWDRYRKASLKYKRIKACLLEQEGVVLTTLLMADAK